MPRKRVEGAMAELQRGGQAIEAAIDEAHNPGLTLKTIVVAFKATQPDQWEAIKLAPAEYALNQMIEALDK